MNGRHTSTLPRSLVPLLFVSTGLALRGASTLGQVTENARNLAERAAASTSLGEVLMWLAIGLLIGTLLGPLATRRGAGFGTVGNLALGLAGAVLGGLMFGQLGINLGLGEFVVNYDTLVAAIAGAAALVLVVFYVKGKSRNRAQA